MSHEIVMLPHPSCESGDNVRIKKQPSEDGEIEDDICADEGLHPSRSLLPASHLIKTSKRKRRRKAVSKEIKKVLKKRKLNHVSSFEETMKVSLDDGTVQTDGNELFAQGKYPIIHSNDTSYRNCDEYLAYSDSSKDCSDPYNDIIETEMYKSYKALCLGLKRPSQKSLKCEQKKLKTKFCKFFPKNKTDKYSYMHSGFPLKFDHTEVRCITDHCKFRHEELTENLTGPKKIMRNYSQVIGDGEAEVMYTKNCHNKSTRKIPSLLEIVVPIPPQFLANDSNVTVNAEQRTPSTCHMTSVDETRPCTLKPSSLKKENSSNSQHGASSDPNHAQMQQIVSDKKEKLSNNKEKQSDIGGCVYDCISAVSSLSSRACTRKNQTETKHHKENIFPHNLPKKQQELFLRIRQKQRQPLDLRNQDLGEQEKTRNEDAKQTVDEQNWYSSDEDDSCLVDVLKNLPRLQSLPSKARISSISTPLSDMPSSSSTSESGDKPLPSIRDQSSNNAANLIARSVPSPNICENFYTMMQILATKSKEPRSSLQNPYHSTISATISEHNSQTPVPTNSSSEETVTYCSSSGNSSMYKAAIESCADGGTGLSKNGSGIVDFRNAHSVQQNVSLQPKIKRDVDLQHNSIPLPSYFSTVNDKIYRGTVPRKDMNLREIMGLPFRPSSLHNPTTEINASLNGHAPIPYKLIPILIPPSDYSGLGAQAQISRDPRLCRTAQISRDPRLHRPSSLYKGVNMSRALEYFSKTVAVSS